MPEQKRKMPIFGKEIDVADVPVVTATETINEYKLEDGSLLRVKNVVTSVVRIEDQFNADGTPIYLIFSTPVTVVVNSPLSRPPK
jgi:hypothetical protein